jgi:hypothetical protein
MRAMARGAAPWQRFFPDARSALAQIFFQAHRPVLFFAAATP